MEALRNYTHDSRQGPAEVLSRAHGVLPALYTQLRQLLQNSQCEDEGGGTSGSGLG